MRLEPLEMMNECVAKCSTRLQYFERGRGGNVDVVGGAALASLASISILFCGSGEGLD